MQREPNPLYRLFPALAGEGAFHKSGASLLRVLQPVFVPPAVPSVFGLIPTLRLPWHRNHFSVCRHRIARKQSQKCHTLSQ